MTRRTQEFKTEVDSDERATFAATANLFLLIIAIYRDSSKQGLNYESNYEIEQKDTKE